MGLEDFQIGEHVEMGGRVACLGEHGNAVPLPKPCPMYPILLFLSYILL